MEISTIIGLVLGMAAIIISIFIDGGVSALKSFVSLPSIFIVLGGVIAATFVSYPMNTIKNLGQYISQTFKAKPMDLPKDVDMIIDVANVARREGILSLEESLPADADPFLKKGIMLIVDGSDPSLVRNILEAEVDYINERHSVGIGVLESMSSYSPAFGMIGTLIGLINMLGSLDDPDALGPGMSVALITTLYGSFLANLIFTPLAKKLKSMNDDEYLRKQLIIEGLMSIQNGENPRIIREKLNSFLSVSQVNQAQSSGESQKDSE